MIEMFTIGKRRARSPSESGSMGLVSGPLGAPDIADSAETLRKGRRGPSLGLGRRLVIENEDVDQRRDGGGDRDRQDNGEPSEHEAYDRDGHKGDHRRQPNRMTHQVWVDDVALELADADEDEQGERGDVERLRQADQDDEDRADER